MYLVIGPNSSGKSAFAERLAVQLNGAVDEAFGESCKGDVHYVATLIPFDERDVLRVEKHIAQRAGMGFITHEDPLLARGSREMSPHDTVLLEDVSNLAANCFFEEDGPVAGLVGESVEQVLSRVADLNRSVAHLVTVAIGDVGVEDGYDAPTRTYIEVLSVLNAALVETADTVVRVHDGVPTLLKGSLPRTER